jgi:sigma-70, region 4
VKWLFFLGGNKLKYEFYRENIDEFTNEDNLFFNSQNSKEYEERKYIMKLFLEVAFELMSKREKIVYKMRNEENKDHKEIASELNISVENSRKTLHRANQKIIRISNLIEKIKFIERNKNEN